MPIFAFAGFKAGDGDAAATVSRPITAIIAANLLGARCRFTEFGP
ncbi:unannotated protein [freshwater metagenome]|uniref:Unannotated protein n=1 Tax=freshwater metagenome TaxID=449393 RepID=A0A6J7D7A6_9ZZZZ